MRVGVRFELLIVHDHVAVVADAQVAVRVRSMLYRRNLTDPSRVDDTQARWCGPNRAVR